MIFATVVGKIEDLECLSAKKPVALARSVIIHEKFVHKNFSSGPVVLNIFFLQFFGHCSVMSVSTST